MDRNKPIQEKNEHRLTELVLRLIRVNLKGLARGILKLARIRLWYQPIPVGPEPKALPLLPAGPFTVARKEQQGDLLLFVPRSLKSLIIDDLSGGYGFSHAAVDCGEVDQPTGKPVMIESTVGRTVERTFLDTYGQRPYVRIRLSKAGINPDQFCACVQSKLGEPYDNLEALTWGQIDDPAKQVCSDLAAVCLKDEIRADIARASQLRILRPHSVTVHSYQSEHGIREFISPNGFAEYFGAPQGENVKQPDVLVLPHPVTATPARAVGHTVHRTYWQIGLVLASLALVGLLIRRVH